MDLQGRRTGAGYCYGLAQNGQGNTQNGIKKVRKKGRAERGKLKKDKCMVSNIKTSTEIKKLIVLNSEPSLCGQMLVCMSIQESE